MGYGEIDPLVHGVHIHSSLGRRRQRPLRELALLPDALQRFGVVAHVHALVLAFELLDLCGNQPVSSTPSSRCSAPEI